MIPSISRYERRDYIAQLNRRSTWHLWVRIGGLAAIFLLLSLYAVIHFRTLHTSANEAAVRVDGVIIAHDSFCRQAVLDHETWGRDLSPDLKEYCK